MDSSCTHPTGGESRQDNKILLVGFSSLNVPDGSLRVYTFRPHPHTRDSRTGLLGHWDVVTPWPPPHFTSFFPGYWYLFLSLVPSRLSWLTEVGSSSPVPCPRFPILLLGLLSTGNSVWTFKTKWRRKYFGFWSLWDFWFPTGSPLISRVLFLTW